MDNAATRKKNVTPKNLNIKDNETVSYNVMYIESENNRISMNHTTNQIFIHHSNLFYTGFRSRETWPCHLYHKIIIKHQIFVHENNNSPVLRREKHLSARRLFSISLGLIYVKLTYCSFFAFFNLLSFYFLHSLALVFFSPIRQSLRELFYTQGKSVRI